jgi:hypothetical protein
MTSGDIPSFKIYDSSENTYYDALASEDIPWEPYDFFTIDYLQNVIYGCIDNIACNYDEDANVDDGSCLYNDCLGECGGSAELDDCGTCDKNPANNCVIYDIELHEHANLISFYALPDTNDIISIFSQLEDNNPGIMGAGFASNYYNGMWLGTLLTIEPEDGYWVVTDGEANLYMEGIPTDPANG